MRLIKLANQVKDVVALAVTTELSDPRLADVTITGAKISADLQVSSIYFRTLKDRHRSAQIALEGAEGFFRKRLASVLDVKRVPALRFYYDTSIERLARIEDLLLDVGRETQAVSKVEEEASREVK